MSGMFSSLGFGANKPSKPPKAIPIAPANISAPAPKEDVKPKPGTVPAKTEIESVARRSVRISFPKGTKTARDIEDDIYRAASMFGTIMDIRIKGKNAVVLYSSVADADRCVSSWADTSLAAQDYKIKSMGLSTSLNQSLDSAAGEEAGMEVLSLSASNSNVSLDLQAGAGAGAGAGNNVPALPEQGGGSSNYSGGGIAFDGSVVESDQTLQVLELEDVSNFDRTADLSSVSLPPQGRVSRAGRASPPVSSSSPPASSSPAVAVTALEDSVGSNGGNLYPPPGQSGGGWKVAEKAQTPPPARPPRKDRPGEGESESVSSGSDQEGSGKGSGKKVLTPKQIRVSRFGDVSDAGAGAAQAEAAGGVNSNTTTNNNNNNNNTYISSANDTSNQSDSVSMYNSNYDGDYNSTLLNISSKQLPAAAASSSSAAKPAAAGGSSTASSTAFSVSSSGTDDHGSTFLTQGNPSRPPKGSAITTAAGSGGDRERVSSFGSDSDGGGGGGNTPQPLFGNILDVPRAQPRSNSGVLEEVLHGNAHAAPLAAPPQRDRQLEELQQRVRVLEAEARVVARERMDFGQEIRTTEENWAVELTALGIRNKTLEAENAQLRDDGQRAKMELAKLVSVVSALEARGAAHATQAGSSRSEADRDAYGALLAQQKLVEVLTSHKAASEAQVVALQGEVTSLAAAHKAAAEEGYKWKARATRLEEELAVLQAVAAAEEQQEQQTEDAGGEDKASQALTEISSRKVLANELQKYLAIERSIATPVLAQHQAESVWKYTARGTQFGAFFDLATESSTFAAESTAQQKPYLHSHTARYSSAIPQHWRSQE